MIVRRLIAENLLKYRRLELDTVPEKGLVAISGANESGKSSIGETLCFALFGRTFALGPDDLVKVIRWGQPRASVTLEFSVDDGRLYRISRSLDDLGHHGARLESLEGGELVAKGADEVTGALRGLIGIDFAEYIDSFYLAQREITTPHPHSQAVKRMAGVAELAEISEALDESLLVEDDAIAETQEELGNLERELAELEIDDQRLTRLTGLHHNCMQQRAATEEADDTVQRAGDRYARLKSELDGARRSQRRNHAVTSLGLFLGLVNGGIWAILNRLPESGLAQRLNTLLEAQGGEWWAFYQPWLLHATIAFGVLFLLGWAMGLAAGGRQRRLRAEAEALSAELEPLEERVASDTIEQIRNSMQEELWEESLENLPELPADGDPAAAISSLGRRIAAAAEPEGVVRSAVTDLTQVLERRVEWLRAAEAVLAAEVEEEKTLHAERDRILQVMEGVGGRLEEQKRRIQVQELARELIHGAARQLSFRFNQEVRNRVSEILPRFTDGRYEYLQIDDDLGVRVFSKEKQDFLDFDEISSGTQRQILLAVRLALALELVETAAHGPQYLFLDEPFAFFDEERMQGAMEALPHISDAIQQIWIVAQTFPPNAPVDLEIHCQRDLTVLEIGEGKEEPSSPSLSAAPVAEAEAEPEDGG